MQIIGHRGAKGLATENTLASIEQALRYPIDMIEIDLRTTHDGHVVLAHDHVIDSVVIESSTYSQLKAVHPEITLLHEAFAAIPPKMPINLEIKQGSNIEHITAVVAAELVKGRRAKDLLISSFHFPTLRAAHNALPEIPTAVLEKYFGLRAASRARRIGTKRIHFAAFNLWGGYIRAVTRSGYQLYAFTVNDPEKAQKWGRAGLRGVFTDFPDRFTHTAKD